MTRDVKVRVHSGNLHSKDIKKQIASHRLCRNEYLLLFTLMAFSFIPSINQLIVDRLVSGMGSSVLNIAGQIEWFDLFNETMLSFIT